ncbi:MAG: COG4223 family protein [Caulobacterales bacterium]
MGHFWLGMSVAPDPAELAPTRDPAAYGRRPISATAFWAIVALCVGCVLAGIAIGRFGPAAIHSHPAVAPAAEPSRGAAPEAAAPTPATAPAPFEAVGPAPASDDLKALAARVERLETSQSRAQDASAAALAAAALSEAAAGAGPFTGELAAFERVMPNSPDLQALRPLAAQGAPTRAELAATLPASAAAAAVAARAPQRGDGFLKRLAAMVSRVIIIRRVDPDAPGADGVLARAQARAAAADLEGALSVLNSLPAEAQAPLDEWRAAARRRVEIDRHVAGLRAQALADLVARQGSSEGSRP